MRLKDKVCIVTGGAQGIGKSIVEKFASEGAKVVLVIDIKEASFKESNIECFIADTTNKADIQKIVDSAISKYGKIDVVVNNAGVTRDALCHKMTDEQWDLVLNINLKAPHYMVQSITEQMMKQGSGSIISIGSVIGLYGNIGQVNYGATKAGLIAMSKTWTKELSRKGAHVRANVVAPGFIDTPILESMPEHIVESMKQKILFKELGKTDDVANAVLFLASDESAYITGQVLEVSGGLAI